MALEAAIGHWGPAVEKPRQRLLAGAMIALNGRNLEVGSYHLRLHQQLSPNGIHTHDRRRRGCIQLARIKVGREGSRPDLSGGLHGDQVPRLRAPSLVHRADKKIIGIAAKNMNRRELISPVRV